MMGPLTGGANNRRRTMVTNGNFRAKRKAAEDQVVSIDGELALLRQFYGAAIDIARRTVLRRDRPAAIRALRRELKAAIFAVTTRHRNEQASRRALLRYRRETNEYTIK